MMSSNLLVPAGGAPPTKADDDMDGKPNTNSGGTFVASGWNAISQTVFRGGGDDANLRSGSGTEVGAFATGEEERRNTSAMILQVVAAPIFSGDLRRGMVCCSPLVAKPSPQMVASFPWDGESDSRTGKSSKMEAVSGNKEANAMKVLKQDGDELQRSMMRTTTPWILGCRRGMPSTFWKMTHDGAPLGQHCVLDLGSITPCHGLGYEFLGEVQYAATHGQKQFYWILSTRFYFKQWDPGGNF